MSIRPCIVFGIVASALFSTNAISNQASTEYVKEAVNALRQDLGNQFGSQFDVLNKALNQLAITTNELASTTNQLSSVVNDLSFKLTNLTTQTNESSTSINNKIEVVQNQVQELPIITHQHGEIFQGGIVFYVDASHQHGLMASLSDLGQEGIEWRNGPGGDRMVNATSQGLGSGETNTRLIIAEQTIDQQEGGQFAALQAANYQIAADGLTPCTAEMSASSTCYGGWYLPSAFELLLLHANLKKQGLSPLADAPYWSSSEASVTEAWLVDFSSGRAEVREKSSLARVRAIHTF